MPFNFLIPKHAFHRLLAPWNNLPEEVPWPTKCRHCSKLWPLFRTKRSERKHCDPMVPKGGWTRKPFCFRVCVCVCMDTCVYKGHPISLHRTLGNVSLATQMELEARHLPFLLPHGSLSSRTCSVAPHLKGDFWTRTSSWAQDILTAAEGRKEVVHLSLSSWDLEKPGQNHEDGATDEGWGRGGNWDTSNSAIFRGNRIPNLALGMIQSISKRQLSSPDRS